MDLITRPIFGALILGAVYAVIVFVLNFLPPSEQLPVEVVNGVTYFFSLLRGLDFILPMQTFLNVFLASLSYIGIKIAFRLGLWVLHLVTKILPAL